MYKPQNHEYQWVHPPKKGPDTFIKIMNNIKDAS